MIWLKVYSFICDVHQPSYFNQWQDPFDLEFLVEQRLFWHFLYPRFVKFNFRLLGRDFCGRATQSMGHVRQKRLLFNLIGESFLGFINSYQIIQRLKERIRLVIPYTKVQLEIFFGVSISKLVSFVGFWFVLARNFNQLSCLQLDRVLVVFIVGI